MKNMTAKFTCATESTLSISAHQGKKDWVISFRQRTPGERIRLGKKEYVELSREDEAQRLFDERVKEALAAGWVPAERGARTSSAFTEIPKAPSAAVAASATNAAPRAAAARR
jgi:hypothetical protein